MGFDFRYLDDETKTNEKKETKHDEKNDDHEEDDHDEEHEDDEHKEKNKGDESEDLVEEAEKNAMGGDVIQKLVVERNIKIPYAILIP